MFFISTAKPEAILVLLCAAVTNIKAANAMERGSCCEKQYLPSRTLDR